MLVSPPLDDYPDIPGEPPTVGVLASGSGSNFETLVEHVDDGQLSVEIGGLVCNNPGAGCLDRARRLGIDAQVIDHRAFEDRETFDGAVVGHLREVGVDWVVMAGWMRIVTGSFIAAYRDRIINLHPSLLPAFRGAHAVEDAMQAGVRITGCSVHLVTEEVDAGPLVAQAAVPVRADDDVDTLQDRIHDAEHWLFPRAIARVIASRRRFGDT